MKGSLRQKGSARPTTQLKRTFDSIQKENDSRKASKHIRSKKTSENRKTTNAPVFTSSLQIKTQKKLNEYSYFPQKSRVSHSKSTTQGIMFTPTQSQKCPLFFNTHNSESSSKLFAKEQITKDSLMSSIDLSQKLEMISSKCPDKFSQYKIAMLKANYFYRNQQFSEALEIAKLALGK